MRLNAKLYEYSPFLTDLSDLWDVRGLVSMSSSQCFEVVHLVLPRYLVLKVGWGELWIRVRWILDGEGGGREWMVL